MKRVAIIVEGGIVQNVFGNGIEYMVIDHDDKAATGKFRVSGEMASPMKQLTNPIVRKLLNKEGW